MAFIAPRKVIIERLKRPIQTIRQNFPSPRGGYKQLATNVAQGVFGKRAPSGQLGGFVAPQIFPAGGAVRGATNILSRGVTAIKTGITRATLNPFANMGVRASAKKLIGGFIGGASGATALNLAFSGGSGDPINLARGLRGGILTGLGTALNPSLAIPSFIAGLGTRGFRTAKAQLSEMIPQNLPQPFPTIPDMGAQTFNFPDSPINITFPSELGMPNVPSAAAGFGFSPSVNVGGGTDFSPLLLALIGGGAGYLLGKKKRRRRKKYKRRRYR